MNGRNAVALYSFKISVDLCLVFMISVIKDFEYPFGYMVGLYMLFLGGCTTRLGNDVGSSVIKAFICDNNSVISKAINTATGKPS